jgi:V8-like Glu-specific endopeptidase
MIADGRAPAARTSVLPGLQKHDEPVTLRTVCAGGQRSRPDSDLTRPGVWGLLAFNPRRNAPGVEMRIQRSATVAATLVLAALPILASGVAAGGGGDARSAGQAAEHSRIVSHWTEARLRAAVPRDFAFDSVRGFHAVPKAKPQPPGGGGGNTTGASWPNGTGKVYKATGKVYFEMGSSGYVCSGTALSNSRGGTDGVVLTAGHCAYDETARAFAQNWLFIPQFDSSPTFTCASTTFGCWTAKALVVNNGYASAGGFNNQAVRYDWAFAVVGGGGKTTGANLDLDATVGNFSHQATEMALNTTASAFGYPAAGKYRGKDLTYCQGPTTRDSNPGTNNYKLACNMTGGSSGGPWFSGFDATGNAGVARSLNSYGYSGQSFMYGPIFNSTTTSTYNAANSAATNTIVP